MRVRMIDGKGVSRVGALDTFLIVCLVEGVENETCWNCKSKDLTLEYRSFRLLCSFE